MHAVAATMAKAAQPHDGAQKRMGIGFLHMGENNTFCGHGPTIGRRNVWRRAGAKHENGLVKPPWRRSFAMRNCQTRGRSLKTCYRTYISLSQGLVIYGKCLSLHCVFHSIRFKVYKDWDTAVSLFLYPLMKTRSQPVKFVPFMPMSRTSQSGRRGQEACCPAA